MGKFKIKGLRWYIAGLLCLVTMINYIDRTCLSVAAPALKKSLHIDEQQFSYIVTAFGITYGLMQPISGRIIDWLGTKAGFSLAVLWWSIANILHALARTPRSFGMFRSLLAVGEAGNFPGIAKTGSEWFPPKERTMATGIANIGSGTGSLIAFPLVGSIIAAYGWQEAFVFTGLLGLVWLPIWLLLYHSPQRHPCITAQELEHIESGQRELNAEALAKPSEKGVWKIVFRERNFWGIAAARFLSEPAWQFITYWIPLYLATQRGMKIKEIGLYAWVPFLAADLGSFVGGALSPVYQRLGLKVLTARKAAMTTAALLMPFTLLIATAPSGGWAIFWFCFGAFGHNAISATLLTLPADVFPKRTVATANGLSGSMGYFGGAIFMLIVGWTVVHHGYTPVFTMIAFMDLVGAMFLWMLIREPKSAEPELETVQP